MTDSTLFEQHSDTFSPDIGLHYCGKRIATKNHVYGPEIRSHYLIVYVEDGKAMLYQKNKKLPFGKGQLLIMFPGEKIFYKAQTDWSIRWIGLNGNGVNELFSLLNITPKYPFLTIPKDIPIVDLMEKIYNAQNENTLSNKYKTLSLLFELFSYMLASANKEPSYNSINDVIASAKNIIAYNYNNHLNITAIAQKLFLAPAYFSRLFKATTGLSPKQYVTKIRIEKAKELLIHSKHSIKNISLTIGYQDPLYFSKLFIKQEHLTPSEFRKKYCGV
jgi:AraC-like DNA-binding protein